MDRQHDERLRMILYQSSTAPTSRSAAPFKGHKLCASDVADLPIGSPVPV